MRDVRHRATPNTIPVSFGSVFSTISRFNAARSSLFNLVSTREDYINMYSETVVAEDESQEV